MSAVIGYDSVRLRGKSTASPEVVGSMPNYKLQLQCPITNNLILNSPITSLTWLRYRKNYYVYNEMVENSGLQLQRRPSSYYCHY